MNFSAENLLVFFFFAKIVQIISGKSSAYLVVFWAQKPFFAYGDSEKHSRLPLENISKTITAKRKIRKEKG